MIAFSRIPLPHLKQRDGELEVLELGVNTHNNHLDLEETWNHHDKYHGIWNTNQDTYFSIFPSKLKNTYYHQKAYGTSSWLSCVWNIDQPFIIRRFFLYIIFIVQTGMQEICAKRSANKDHAIANNIFNELLSFPDPAGYIRKCSA